LIGLFLEVEGRPTVQYFTSFEAAERAVPATATQEALDLAGVWSDMDWDEMMRELDRIRHESTPSPPLSL
jgi:hypothetical protein